ncbi:hypothetical protein [Paenibacillus sp. HB172176]|uniref:hypothetical protein n=1 Tax=Paenibacillus sp. HB172176 TaxID=2493690 RepID=UPI001439C5E4|nr:hypothetical protein [Paenibacillus sp. HB172176]
MELTPNLNLKKPGNEDNVNIDDFNDNADVLDTEVAKLASATEAGRMSAADKVKLNGIATGAQVNTVTSVAGKTGAVTLAKADVGLNNVDNAKQATKTEFDAHVAASSGAHAASAISATGGTTVQAEINSLKSSVSDGKALIASAITDKGVDTEATDTFATMADNIGDIELSSGNATAADVLATKTFSNDSGPGQVGSMPNRGAVSITPGAAAQTIAAGYHNGSGTVTGDADLVTGNIKAGASIFGVAGKSEVVDTTEGSVPASASQILSGRKAYVNGSLVTGSMPDRSGDTAAVSSAVSDTTLRLRASAGYRDGSNDYVTLTDADFIAANIPEDINLFGLQGALVRGKKFASGTTLPVTLETGGKTAYVEITGLSFVPSLICVSFRYIYDWLALINGTTNHYNDWDGSGTNGRAHTEILKTSVSPTASNTKVWLLNNSAYALVTGNFSNIVWNAYE